jgi:tetratricopeptide (TPR) repeat protein
MVGVSARHAVVLDELVGWWRDLSGQEINSQAVLLPVPPRWGRTHLLNQFAAVVEEDEAPSIVVRVRGASLPDGLGLQALALRDLFREARVEHRAAELLGVNRLGKVVQLGLSVAGLFISPLAALVGLLLASVGVDAAGKVWDNSPAGQEGTIAKLARAVAALSTSVPVVVIIDDAEQLEPDPAVILVENLIERANGRVLVIAAISPGANMLSALTSRAAYGLTEDLVQTLNVDPGMGYQARVDLATDLCPHLPAAAIRRIGQRTQTFAEVFAVTEATLLTEPDTHDDQAATVTMVDAVIDARVSQASPSKRAVAVAWAGGVLHARQAERAVEVLGGKQPGDDGDVLRFESLVRLADPASPRLAEQVRILSAGERLQLAETVLDTAAEVGADHEAGIVDKVVAWQAAHRVRADLQNHARLPGMQCELVHGLQDLGDQDAAFQVAKTALAEYPASQPGKQQTPEHDDLAAAVLRLAHTQQSRHDDPLIDATVAAAVAGGAAVGLEARVWAAVDLLSQPGQRERALQLTDQIAAALNRRHDLGVIGDRWRLLLAFHVGRAGYPAITQQLLAPMLGTSSAPENGDAARAVLYAVGGPGADTRLQIVGLEAELAALPPDTDDEQLRVHHALAANYEALGDYRRALHHSQEELQLRRRIQGDDHPDTLDTRNQIAASTHWAGNPAKAVQLFQELLPDRLRILGPDHLDTLRTRSGLAIATGDAGNLGKELRLLENLLPDMVRVLGRDHSATLSVRTSIASTIGNSGHPAKALRLFQDLLPDYERAFGRSHTVTLNIRNSHAAWTGYAAMALS